MGGSLSARWMDDQVDTYVKEDRFRALQDWDAGSVRIDSCIIRDCNYIRVTRCL